VIYKLLGNNPVVLQMQEELETGMTLEQTAAGSQLSADLDASIMEHEAEMNKVLEEMEDAMNAKDEAWQRERSDELAKLKEDMTRSFASKERLRNRCTVCSFFRPVHDLTEKVL
jgi:predicted phage gp36 major capsid-like protein